MNSTLSKVFIFAAGAVIGSAVTWKFVKAKYEAITREEIESVKEYYSRKANGDIDEDVTDEVAEKEQEPINPELQEFVDKLNNFGYTENKEVPKVSAAQVIDPDEFGENMDYDQVYLTHYADGVLADEYDEPVEDADDIVGSDYVNHFGDHGEDLVHVKNDELETYYEITMDVRNWRDVVDSNPHRAEVE